MGKQVRVALHGEQRRNIMVEAGATEGAVVGSNLVWSDGTVVTEADIRNSSSSTTTSTSNVWKGATLWQLIVGIPGIIDSLGDLTDDGWIRNDSGTLSALHWPYIKDSIETGETLTIPEDSQAIVFQNFTFDGGTIVIDGELVVLGGDGEGPVKTAFVSKGVDYTLTDADHVVKATATGLTFTMMTAVGREGSEFILKNHSSGVLTVDANGSETIDGGLTATLSDPYESITVISDGANWNIV